ncbi:CAP domain-containing protein [Streptomyces viridochromogenes]|uniref:Putative membrane-anchored protein n=1 Tax=Streptomyces viridochromogenes Tue57 TaxID=1160705 RepID=L8PK08_STRVR|nr:CAP domain-containing protein [Streptomyces viridochromogenes]ELS56785.1 putative membrane-anchored protein [Streptomyces viridochromogenes Tue57]
MGRHRRSAAGRAATGRATGVTQTDGSCTQSHDPQDSYTSERPTMGIAPYLNPEAYAEAYAKSDAYLFATDDDYDRVTGTTTFPAEAGSTGGSAAGGAFPGDGFSPDAGSRRPAGGSRRRRRKKAAAPVKTGLLGVSAAVALGTVAVAAGVVPGIDNYQLGGGSATDKVRSAGTPTNAPVEQGGTSGSADSQDDGAATSRDAQRPASPSPSTSSAAPTKTPSKEPSATPSEKPKETPSRTATKAPQKQKTSAPVHLSAQAAAAAEVLQLVNEERAQVGCSAVAANSSLTELAQDFSEDMAARGFFDHTDPDGASPWDRAAKAGITDLGGENIARGQSDAAAVMEAWMNSPGHKANILNCDFKTLGVGVHFGSGGPWWTQDFGY